MFLFMLNIGQEYAGVVLKPYKNKKNPIFALCKQSALRNCNEVFALRSTFRKCWYIYNPRWFCAMIPWLSWNY